MEPALGTSWYSKSGPTPTFAEDQKNGTAFMSMLGSDALLDCQVTAVEQDLVSWFKVPAVGVRIPMLLTVGFRPAFSKEDRYSLDFTPPHNYR